MLVEKARASNHRGTVRIEQSTFSGLGQCPENGNCSHSIYNSGDAILVVTRSRFAAPAAMI